MDLQDAIVHSIRELCEEKHLNATNIANNGENMSWESSLGILGQVEYCIPFSEFRKSLEYGMRSVSILIAFTDLITQETNKEMINNINEAKKRGANTYFMMPSSDSNIVRMSVPKATNRWEYTTIPIKFTILDDGKYQWDIPESVGLYSIIYDNQYPLSIGELASEDLSNVISEYAGLGGRESSGVPVLQATQSTREYSIDYGSDPIELNTTGNPVIQE